jgi:hypothetical protein
MGNMKTLPQTQVSDLLGVLKARFEKNMARHAGLDWVNVQAKLVSQPEKLWSLNQMGQTGGEPDVVAYDTETGTYTFFDCAPESPKERRSFCYDAEALESRKTFKPDNSALQAAADMGIAVLTEAEYRYLQSLGKFDTKTSSWLKTPDHIRKLGGAIFGDFRFGTVFIYHNGVESYYGSRGFRGGLVV